MAKPFVHAELITADEDKEFCNGRRCGRWTLSI
jgi:hypothetical protein